MEEKNIENRNILITGASGFIGGFLVEAAIARGYKVYAGVRGTSSRKYLKHPEINFVELDFGNPAALNSSLSALKARNIAFEYIIHNAGATRSSTLEGYYTVNCQYTINFIEAIRHSGLLPRKFVYISSLAAYGPGDPKTLESIAEAGKPNPVTTYGKSKLKAENYIKSLIAFPYIIIRPTAVYGPREKDLFTFFKLLNRGIEGNISGPKQYLSFIYVKDLIKAIFIAMESNETNAGYFVTDGSTYSKEELARYSKNALKARAFRIIVPSWLVRFLIMPLEKIYSLFGRIPLLNKERINELTASNWICDTTPLIRLGFKPDYNLQQGINEAIEWYKKEGWL